MYNSFNKIMWGIVVIFFDFNLGSLDIIPDFLGYILIISGVNYLFKNSNYNEFHVSLYLLFVLLIQSIVSMFFVGEVNDYLSYGFVIMVIGMILHALMVYYLYSGIIKMLDNTELKESAYLFRNAFVLITLISCFSFTFFPNLSRDINSLILILVTISTLIMYVIWIFNIKKIRNYYTNN